MIAKITVLSTSNKPYSNYIKVIDMETGEEIKGIQCIHIHEIEPMNVVKGDITVCEKDNDGKYSLRSIPVDEIDISELTMKVGTFFIVKEGNNETE